MKRASSVIGGLAVLLGMACATAATAHHSEADITLTFHPGDEAAFCERVQREGINPYLERAWARESKKVGAGDVFRVKIEGRLGTIQRGMLWNIPIRRTDGSLVASPYQSCFAVFPTDAFQDWRPLANSRVHWGIGEGRLILDFDLVIDTLDWRQGTQAKLLPVVFGQLGSRFLSGNRGGAISGGVVLDGRLDVRTVKSEASSHPPGVPPMMDRDTFLTTPSASVLFFVDGNSKMEVSRFRLTAGGPNQGGAIGILQRESWGTRWTGMRLTGFDGGQIRLYGHVDFMLRDSYLMFTKGVNVMMGDQSKGSTLIGHSECAAKRENGCQDKQSWYTSEARFDASTIEGARDFNVLVFGGIHKSSLLNLHSEFSGGNFAGSRKRGGMDVGLGVGTCGRDDLNTAKLCALDEDCEGELVEECVAVPIPARAARWECGQFVRFNIERTPVRLKLGPGAAGTGCETAGGKILVDSGRAGYTRGAGRNDWAFLAHHTTGAIPLVFRCSPGTSPRNVRWPEYDELRIGRDCEPRP